MLKNEADANQMLLKVLMVLFSINLTGSPWDGWLKTSAQSCIHKLHKTSDIHPQLACFFVPNQLWVKKHAYLLHRCDCNVETHYLLQCTGCRLCMFKHINIRMKLSIEMFQ